jgi:phosphohistidine phosphatase SixA
MTVRILAVQILLVILTFCWIAAANADNDSDRFNLYLIRHAEKQTDGSRDPALTEAGKQRSEQLAGWFGDKDIQKIWSSDYQRTRDTVTPLLNRSGLELAVYDPHDQAALAGTLLLEKQNAVIAGHSNTIPELARLLCHCDVEDMPESEYGRLIVVVVGDGKTRAETLQQDQLFHP